MTKIVNKMIGFIVKGFFGEFVDKKIQSAVELVRAEHEMEISAIRTEHEAVLRKIKALDSRIKMLATENLIQEQCITILNTKKEIPEQAIIDRIVLQLGNKFDLTPREARKIVKPYFPNVIN